MIEQSGSIEIKTVKDIMTMINMTNYSIRAKEQWGDTPEYKECAEKTKNRSDAQEREIADGLMSIFVGFGQMMDCDVADERVQSQVKKLQDYISENYYKCSDEVLGGLGKMYAAGGEFTENIDKAGGAGTAVFAARAIEVKIGSEM